MHRDEPIYPQTTDGPRQWSSIAQDNASPEDLKAQARMKEFQIKTLIRAAQVVHNISPDMMQAALLVAEKERAVIQAKNELAQVKNDLAQLIR